MYRYIVLISAVLMQMCLGATYSWSVYVHRLKLETGLGQGLVQIPFTIFYFMFPATMVFVGSVLNRIGTRKCAIIGGALFGAGWIIAGFGVHNFTLTVFGIGFLAGIGVGFAYMVPIATAILWFPNHKGLVTGISVAGFGGGAALVSQVGEYLMVSLDYSPFQAFTVLGIVFLLTVTSSGSFMTYPKGFLGSKDSKIAFNSLLQDKTFLLLYLSMFSGLAAGFTINANLKELFPVLTSSVGVLAVSLFAVANAFGRVSWGFFCDRVTPLRAIELNLIFQSLLIAFASYLLKKETGFLIFASIAGFNYGGVLVIYASTAARKWGADKVGPVYGRLFSANIPAAIAPLLAGLIFDATGSFDLFLWILASAMIIMVLGNRLYLKQPLEKM